MVSASKGKEKWVSYSALCPSLRQDVSQSLLTIVSPTPAQLLQIHGAFLLTPLLISKGKLITQDQYGSTKM